MISLLELEKELDLSEYERKLGNKRTRAGKFFWLTVLILYDDRLKKEKAFDKKSWALICKEYANIFYKPLELSLAILDPYDGMLASELKALPIHDSVEVFKRELWIKQLELEKSIRSLLRENGVDFSEIDPAKIELFKVDFLDNRHPYLPTISESYKIILDASEYPTIKDGKLLAHREDLKLLKRSKVRHFNKVMDELTRYRYMIKTVEYLYKRLKKTPEIFHVRYQKEGPQAAVDHFIANNPEMASLPAKQLKYFVHKKYRELDGEKFDNGSLRNAINKFKDEQ